MESTKVIENRKILLDSEKNKQRTFPKIYFDCLKVIEFIV
jgi:hypothetical protein